MTSVLLVMYQPTWHAEPMVALGKALIASVTARNAEPNQEGS